MSGCADKELVKRLAQAKADAREANIALRALKEAEASLSVKLPDLPHVCRTALLHHVKEGDRLDVALLKMRAVTKAYEKRQQYCSGWYDKVQAAYLKSD